jgi:hypothetical protein
MNYKNNHTHAFIDPNVLALIDVLGKGETGAEGGFFLLRKGSIVERLDFSFSSGRALAPGALLFIAVGR